jgi:hypothetical protein
MQFVDAWESSPHPVSSKKQRPSRALQSFESPLQPQQLHWEEEQGRENTHQSQQSQQGPSQQTQSAQQARLSMPPPPPRPPRQSQKQTSGAKGVEHRQEQEQDKQEQDGQEQEGIDAKNATNPHADHPQPPSPPVGAAVEVSDTRAHLTHHGERGGSVAAPIPGVAADEQRWQREDERERQRQEERRQEEQRQEEQRQEDRRRQDEEKRRQELAEEKQREIEQIAEQREKQAQAQRELEQQRFELEQLRRQQEAEQRELEQQRQLEQQRWELGQQQRELEVQRERQQRELELDQQKQQREREREEQERALREQQKERESELEARKHELEHHQELQQREIEHHRELQQQQAEVDIQRMRLEAEKQIQVMQAEAAKQLQLQTEQQQARQQAQQAAEASPVEAATALESTARAAPGEVDGPSEARADLGVHARQQDMRSVANATKAAMPWRKKATNLGTKASESEPQRAPTAAAALVEAPNGFGLHDLVNAKRAASMWRSKAKAGSAAGSGSGSDQGIDSSIASEDESVHSAAPSERRQRELKLQQLQHEEERERVQAQAQVQATVEVEGASAVLPLVIRMQALCRGYHVRATLAELVRQEEEQEAEEQFAAIRIQTFVRAALARQAVDEFRHLWYCALIIQCAGRGRIARTRFNQRKGAVLIQLAMQRAELYELAAVKEARSAAAALVMQNSWRARRARNVKRELEHGAKVKDFEKRFQHKRQQKVARGLTGALRIRQLSKAKAVAKLQALARGVRIRRLMRSPLQACMHLLIGSSFGSIDGRRGRRSSCDAGLGAIDRLSLSKINQYVITIQGLRRVMLAKAALRRKRALFASTVEARASHKLERRHHGLENPKKRHLRKAMALAAAESGGDHGEVQGEGGFGSLEWQKQQWQREWEEKKEREEQQRQDEEKEREQLEREQYQHQHQHHQHHHQHHQRGADSHEDGQHGEEGRGVQQSLIGFDGALGADGVRSLIEANRQRSMQAHAQLEASVHPHPHAHILLPFRSPAMAHARMQDTIGTPSLSPVGENVEGTASMYHTGLGFDSPMPAPRQRGGTNESASMMTAESHMSTVLADSILQHISSNKESASDPESPLSFLPRHPAQARGGHFTPGVDHGVHADSPTSPRAHSSRLHHPRVGSLLRDEGHVNTPGSERSMNSSVISSGGRSIRDASMHAVSFDGTPNGSDSYYLNSPAVGTPDIRDASMRDVTMVDAECDNEGLSPTRKAARYWKTFAQQQQQQAQQPSPPYQRDQHHQAHQHQRARQKQRKQERKQVYDYQQQQLAVLARANAALSLSRVAMGTGAFNGSAASVTGGDHINVPSQRGRGNQSPPSQQQRGESGAADSECWVNEQEDSTADANVAKAAADAQVAAQATAEEELVRQMAILAATQMNELREEAEAKARMTEQQRQAEREIERDQEQQQQQARQLVREKELELELAQEQDKEAARRIKQLDQAAQEHQAEHQERLQGNTLASRFDAAASASIGAAGGAAGGAAADTGAVQVAAVVAQALAENSQQQQLAQPGVDYEFRGHKPFTSPPAPLTPPSGSKPKSRWVGGRDGEETEDELDDGQHQLQGVDQTNAETGHNAGDVAGAGAGATPTITDVTPKRARSGLFSGRKARAAAAAAAGAKVLTVQVQDTRGLSFGHAVKQTYIELCYAGEAKKVCDVEDPRKLPLWCPDGADASFNEEVRIPIASGVHFVA